MGKEGDVLMFNDETMAQHPLSKHLKEICSLEIKLAEARKQESDWRKIATQHENELNDIRKKARELSAKLFANNYDSSKYGEWNPAG